jgi:hypothetical protein
MENAHTAKNAVTKVTLEAIEVGAGPLGMGPPNYRGVSYLCPSCLSVLSVSIDPISVREEIISGVVDRLRKDSRH